MVVGTPEGLDPVNLPLDEHVEVVRMASFAFDPRSGQQQEWPVAVGVDVASWASAVLVVVVHSINTWAPDAVLLIAVDTVELDPDDPKQLFPGTTIASVVLGGSTQAGTSQVASFTPPWGSRIRVVLRPWQRGVEATAEQMCTLTIRLVGRRQGLIGAPRVLEQRSRDR